MYDVMESSSATLSSSYPDSTVSFGDSDVLTSNPDGDPTRYGSSSGLDNLPQFNTKTWSISDFTENDPKNSLVAWFRFENPAHIWSHRDLDAAAFTPIGFKTRAGSTFKLRSPVRSESKKLEEDVARAYTLRIKFLQDEAKEEGIRINLDSEIDLWKFFEYEPDLKKASIVLLENGNLRAVWKGEENAHVGLQFLGSGMIQYLFFLKRPDETQISRSVGRDNFDGVARLLTAFSLRSVVRK